MINLRVIDFLKNIAGLDYSVLDAVDKRVLVQAAMEWREEAGKILDLLSDPNAPEGP